MNEDTCKCYKTSEWYQDLAEWTFPTSFVKLNDEELKALQDGIQSGEVVDNILKRLAFPMSDFPGKCFVFTDTVAPTDTERFELKRGAVYSSQSAWRFLCESRKVKNAIIEKKIKHICIRPFRRMSKPREFRLFIKDGELKAMSQYWLIRHFRRIEGRKQDYWEMAQAFVKEVVSNLPDQTIVMDIYFTSENRILIIDFNPWEEETAPLIFRTWERDWNKISGIKLITPPTQLGGDVNVSF